MTQDDDSRKHLGGVEASATPSTVAGSNEIERTIEDADIEGSYTSTHHMGVKRPETIEETWFSGEAALALLLLNNVAFLNSYWFEEKWPADAKKAIAVFVNCNDIFAWGCADAEPLPFDQLETLYRMWRKDKRDGHSVWCMIRRNQMAQGPVEKQIRAAGIWDLDKLGLGKNTQDAECMAYLAAVLAQRKDDLIGGPPSTDGDVKP